VIDVSDSVLDSGSITDFFKQLTFGGGRLFSDDGSVECGLMFKGESGQTLFCGGSPTITSMYMGIDAQHAIGEGPALQALSASELQVADDTSDVDHPPFFQIPASLGFASILSVPLKIGTAGFAALNFYAQPVAFFTVERQRIASVFAEQVGTSVEMRVRLTRYQELTVNMRSAMESRTTIDTAIGIIISQNQCTQEEAFAILRRASNSRQIKLRDVAKNLVMRASGVPPITHFTT
jgi:hypothetical protein